MKLNWKKIYDLYPVNKKYIYLNNAGTTPAGSHILEQMKKYLKDYSENGIYGKKFPLMKTSSSIKEIISNLVNCNNEDVAVIHNTAEGMNFISHGLNLKKNDEILLMKNEYPSNVYPWEHWEQKGIKIRFLDVMASPDEFYNNFIKKITVKTKVVSLSAVHWCTGMPIPIKKIAKICKNNKIYFIVDGAQGAGHVKIDMKKWGIDFMCFSSWKWLLGPLGTGVLIIKKERLKELKYIFKGTSSVASEREYLPYKKDLKKNTDRYVFSTQNYNDWIYFNESLKFLNKTGFANIMNRIYSLSDHISKGLSKLGFAVLRNDFNNVKTGIVCASNNKINSKELSNMLFKKNIIAPERQGNIRFAPHIYNSEKQIDIMLKYIKKNI